MVKKEDSTSQTDASVHAGELFSRQIWDASTDAMAISDAEGIVLDANPAYLHLYGYTLEQIQGQSFALIFPEELQEWAVEQYKVVFAGEDAPAPFESIVRRADGGERVVESRATFLTVEGRRMAMLSTIRDITARKQVEEAQQLSEARYRAFVHATTNSLYRLSANGLQILEVYGDSLQHSQKSISTPTWIEQYVHPDDKAATYAAWRRAVETQTPFEMEHRGLWKDSSWVWVLSRGVPVRNDAGEVVEWICSASNISARKDAEEELRRSKERLRLTMESINDYAIITLDLKGHIVSWNVGAELMFGYSAAEAIGEHTEIIFTPEDRARGAPAHEMEQAFLKGRAADERWHLRKDGLRFYVSGVLSPLHDGTIIGYVKVARDLTEPKKMEEAVRQLNASLEEKVQTRTEQVRNLVTELTMSEQAERRRISHILHDDLQQRLYSLNFQLTTLRHALRDEDQQEAMQTLIEMDEALTDLIQVTRSLSVDLSPPVLHNDGLAEAIQWLAVQMERQHGLGVVVQAEESIPIPNEDLRVLLFQVIRELLFNIVKHAGVATAQVLLAHEKGHVHIEVRDKGNGFDVNVLKAQNTQGLLRIQQRLHLIGGNIEIDTRPGQGTCVTIHSPLRKASG
jgi:PAS domain S-box-containing protein